MRFTVACCALILTVSSRAIAQTGAESIAIVHTNVVQVESGRVLRDATIVIEGGRIVQVARAGVVRIPPGAYVVNGRGTFAIPGLWDMHVHIAIGNSFSDAKVSALVARGIVGVRDMGGAMPTLRRIRETVSPAPRIVAAGRMLDGPLGYKDSTWRQPVDDSASAVAAVDRVLAEGSEFIKTHDWVTRDGLAGAAAGAREHRVRLVGHVALAVGARDAIATGLRDIEHLGNVYGGLLLDISSREQALRDSIFRRKRDGTVIDYIFSPGYIADLLASADSMRERELIALMAHDTVWQVPTLVLHRANEELRADAQKQPPTPAARAALHRLFRRQLGLVRAMHRAGVPFMTGTDNLSSTDPANYESVHGEMRLLVRAGFSNLDALRAATLEPARFLGIESDVGTIASGRLADLVLLDANPLDLIDNTTRITAVVRAGRLLDRATLRRLIAAATP